MKGLRFWNNGKICKRSLYSPGENWVIGRLRYTRVSPSLETKRKISESNKGNIPYNKGLKTYLSEDTLYKMSTSAKIRSKWCLPKNIKQIPWNKGLTAKNNKVIADVASHHKGQTRVGKYCHGRDHPSWNELTQTSKYKEFSKLVRKLSEKEYIKFKDKINPNDYTRGKSGIEGSYQLDHIISIYKGYVNNMKIEELSNYKNLQMLTWQENRQKSSA